jgi:hypothetical protein
MGEQRSKRLGRALGWHTRAAWGRAREMVVIVSCLDEGEGYLSFRVEVELSEP